MKWLLVALVAVLCINDTMNLWYHAGWYNRRLAMLYNVYQPFLDKGCSKAAVKWDAIPELDEWSSGMEALIYSSEMGRSIILSDVEMVNQKKAMLDKTHFVLRLDEVLSYDDLNHRYFNLDTKDYCHQ